MRSSAERILDRVAALRAQHAADLAGRLGRADVGRGGRQRERVGIARDQPARDVDLLELRAREAAGRLARRVHGPEHGADAAGAQARDVGLPAFRRLLADVVGVDVARCVLELADGPGQVVVAVEQDRFREHFFRVIERGVGVSGEGQRASRTAASET